MRKSNVSECAFLALGRSRGGYKISVRKAKQGTDLTDTSLTLAESYNQKPRETPNRKIRRKYAESATRGNVLKPVGTDS